MFFDEDIDFRIKKEDLEKIRKIIDKDGGDKYDNISHFCRCAVLRLIKVENKT